ASHVCNSRSPLPSPAFSLLISSYTLLRYRLAVVYATSYVSRIFLMIVGPSKPCTIICRTSYFAALRISSSAVIFRFGFFGCGLISLYDGCIDFCVLESLNRISSPVLHRSCHCEHHHAAQVESLWSSTSCRIR